MEDEPVIAGLLEKRAELRQLIVELSHELYQTRHKLNQLEQTVRLFAPGIVQAKRQVSTFVRSKYFRPGEITRRCMEAFREADDGVDCGDGRLAHHARQGAGPRGRADAG
jgi:hypothetical protein